MAARNHSYLLILIVLMVGMGLAVAFLRDGGSAPRPPTLDGGAHFGDSNLTQSEIDAPAHQALSLGPGARSGDRRTQATLSGTEAPLRGRLEEQGSGIPIVGGQVLIRFGESTRSATSSGQGEFEILLPAVSQGTLLVSHPEYVDLRTPNLPVPSDEPWVIPMEPAGSIRGRLVGPGAGGEGEAQVELWRWGRGRLEDVPMDVRDVHDNGSFEFTNLPTGNYAVAAIKEGAPPVLRSGVEVQRGLPTDVLVTVPLGAPFTALVEFRGRGGPVAGAVVALEPVLLGRDNPLEERVTREGVTEANGRAPFTGLQSGTHKVNIRTPWGDELTEQVEIQLQSRKSEQRFLFFPPARLSGRVVDPQGQGVADSEVRCIQRSEWSFESNSRIGFSGWGGVSSRQGGEVGATVTDAGGNFEFKRVPTRTSFTVAATSSRAGSGGGQAVGGFGMSEPIHLESGESRAGLILRLGEGFELRGTVRDLEGMPLAGAQVQATVTWKRQELEARLTTTDADGVFVLHGVPAGRCRLTAELEGYTLSDLDKKVEGNLEGLEIQAKPAHTLEGVVLDPAGWGIGGAHVRARDARRRSKRGTADEFGRFLLEGLAPGTWTVNATASGFGAGSGGALSVEVPTPTDIVLRLEPEPETAPCVITGEIAMKGNGNPVRGLRFHGYRYRTISMEGTRFELTGPPAKRLTLTATSPKAESVTFPMVHLNAGDRVDLGRAETRQTIAVTVHVTDAAGRALPDADVSLQRIPGQERGELLVVPKNLRLRPTERKGEFHFDQVGMYQWQLVVRHKAWQAKSLQVKVSNSSKTFNVQLTKDRRRGGGDQ